MYAIILVVNALQQDNCLRGLELWFMSRAWKTMGAYVTSMAIRFFADWQHASYSSAVTPQQYPASLYRNRSATTHILPTICLMFYPTAEHYAFHPQPDFYP